MLFWTEISTNEIIFGGRWFWKKSTVQFLGASLENPGCRIGQCQHPVSMRVVRCGGQKSYSMRHSIIETRHNQRCLVVWCCKGPEGPPATHQPACPQSRLLMETGHLAPSGALVTIAFELRQWVYTHWLRAGERNNWSLLNKILPFLWPININKQNKQMPLILKNNRIRMSFCGIGSHFWLTFLKDFVSVWDCKSDPVHGFWSFHRTLCRATWWC